MAKKERGPRKGEVRRAASRLYESPHMVSLRQMITAPTDERILRGIEDVVLDLERTFETMRLPRKDNSAQIRRFAQDMKSIGDALVVLNRQMQRFRREESDKTQDLYERVINLAQSSWNNRRLRLAETLEGSPLSESERADLHFQSVLPLRNIWSTLERLTK